MQEDLKLTFNFLAISTAVFTCGANDSRAAVSSSFLRVSSFEGRAFFCFSSCFALAQVLEIIITSKTTRMIMNIEDSLLPTKMDYIGPPGKPGNSTAVAVYDVSPWMLLCHVQPHHGRRISQINRKK